MNTEQMNRLGSENSWTTSLLKLLDAKNRHDEDGTSIYIYIYTGGDIGTIAV